MVIYEGELDGSFGFWAEDEDDGAEGFLDAHKDIIIFALVGRFNRPWVTEAGDSNGSLDTGQGNLPVDMIA